MMTLERTRRSKSHTLCDSIPWMIGVGHEGMSPSDSDLAFHFGYLHMGLGWRIVYSILM